jgi:hypothetical protein
MHGFIVIDLKSRIRCGDCFTLFLLETTMKNWQIKEVGKFKEVNLN